MRLEYEPSSEPLHNSAKYSFLNRELYRTVQLSVEELSGREKRGGGTRPDTGCEPFLDFLS